jgi:hypothetical protein
VAGARQHAKRLRPDLALKVTKRAYDRRVGQLALAQLHAVADQDERAGGTGAVGVLGHQAALPHPGLAGHEQCRRVALGRARKRLVEGR